MALSDTGSLGSGRSFARAAAEKNVKLASTSSRPLLNVARGRIEPGCAFGRCSTV